MPHADYSFLGTTQSLCPSCLSLIPAKIIARKGRVYFRKRCSKCGEREDFVCSDVTWYDRMEYVLPGKVPLEHGAAVEKGCPYDCGLCAEHEQHTCVGLVELTSSCNLDCPMCFAVSGPRGNHVSFEECCRSIDRLVAVEGRPEVLQLSGGEPTVHPDFEKVLDYAYDQPIDYIMINTNGVRFDRDAGLLKRVAAKRDRVELFFQLDGLDRQSTIQLRDADLLETKLSALEKAGEVGLHVTLAVTLQGGLNEHEVGPIVNFAAERAWVTAINFQPATYSGRHVLPETLEQRITFPDVIKACQTQTDGLFRPEDFFPLPCAHPNCHSIAYAYRSSQGLVPLTRFIDVANNFDLLANGITLTRARSESLVRQLISRQCCGGECSSSEPNSELTDPLGNSPSTMRDSSTSHQNGLTGLEQRVAQEFFARAIQNDLGARDLLRITITSFLDAYNFDVRRLMKCCTHHVLPSGHVIPFCAYNVLYRNGHVPLPDLVAADSRSR